MTKDRKEYARWYREEKKRCTALGIPMPVRSIRPKSKDPIEQKKRAAEAKRKYKLTHKIKVNKKAAAIRNKHWYENNKEEILKREEIKRKTGARKHIAEKYLAKKKEERAIKNTAKKAEKEARMPEILAERKERNRLKSIERSEIRRKTDSKYRITRAMRLSVNRLLKIKRTKKGEYSTFLLIGIDRDGLLAHLEALFLEGMTWDNYGAWHIDHIRPVASFDLDTDESIRAACHYTNLQPLWAADNRKKADKWTPIGENAGVCVTSIHA